jgi:rubrerythrin
MNEAKLTELLLQSLQQEQGGVEVYTAALACAQREDLRKEWGEYLAQTRRHVQALEEVCRKLKIDPRRETPGRKIVRDLGAALVQAIEQARAAGDPAAAQIVACECIVLAETKDHQDWLLLGKCALAAEGPQAQAIDAAYIAIEDQEDEHLYHTRGWCRELWLEALGLKAVLPPPEERRKVQSEVSAAKVIKDSEAVR